MNKMFYMLLAVFVSFVSCSEREAKNTSSSAGAATSVDTSGEASVSYVEANNYFVRNDAPSTIPSKFTTQASFDSIFGMAASMGNDGLPTHIDFSRQFVIALTRPISNRPTYLDVLSLSGDTTSLNLIYSATVSDSTSYTSHPLLLIVVDREYVNADVSFFSANGR